jgi:hypothetical protein
MSTVRIQKQVIKGTTVSMVRVDGLYEVGTFANGDEVRPMIRTASEEFARCEFARCEFARIVRDIEGVDLLAKYWSESPSTSVENDYKSGRFVTVYL